MYASFFPLCVTNFIHNYSPEAPVNYVFCLSVAEPAFRNFSQVNILHRVCFITTVIDGIRIVSPMFNKNCCLTRASPAQPSQHGQLVIYICAWSYGCAFPSPHHTAQHTKRVKSCLVRKANL